MTEPLQTPAPRTATTSPTRRALLRAGRELVGDDTQTLAAELQWLGEVLGAVRDLDVLLERLRAEGAALGGSDA